jgi:hypothetical protein
VAMQESCEAHLAEYFQDANLADIHAGRVTIKDNFAFVRSIRHEYILFNPSIEYLRLLTMNLDKSPAPQVPIICKGFCTAMDRAQ